MALATVTTPGGFVENLIKAASQNDPNADRVVWKNPAVSTSAGDLTTVDYRGIGVRGSTTTLTVLGGNTTVQFKNPA